MGAFIAIAGVYLQVHVYSGTNIAFPYVLSNLSGLLLLWKFFPYRIQKRRSVFNAFLLINLLFIIQLIPNLSDQWLGDRLKSIVQVDVSLLAALGFILGLLEIGQKGVSRLFFGLGAFIVFVAAFETFGGRDYIVAANEIIYSWRPNGFYQAEGRDEDLWGVVRPLVFSTEPSLPGIYGGIFFTLSFFCKSERSTKAYLAYTGCIALLFFFGRSVTTLIIFAGLVASTVSFQKTNIGVKIVVAVLLIAGIWGFFEFGFLERIRLYVEQASFFARISAPFLVAINVNLTSPFLGAGIGSVEAIYSTIYDVWESSGVFAVQSFAADWKAGDLVTNSFFMHWIYFGIGGGVFFLYQCRKALRALGLSSFSAPFVLTAFCWSTIGGYVDFRTWFVFAAVFASAILNQGIKNKSTTSNWAPNEMAVDLHSQTA